MNVIISLCPVIDSHWNAGLGAQPGPSGGGAARHLRPPEHVDAGAEAGGHTEQTPVVVGHEGGARDVEDTVQ